MEEWLAHLALDPRYFEQAYNCDSGYQRERDEEFCNRHPLCLPQQVRSGV
jgi:hypothetical protein